MAQQKLYTEEQVKEMIEKSRATGLTAEFLTLTTPPIELPSDEEIIYSGKNYAKKVHQNDSMITFRKYSTDDFKAGAKWMRDKIINQNK